MSPLFANQVSKRYRPFYMASVVGLIISFVGSSLSVPQAYADVLNMPPMPQPGVMVHLSPEFTPAILKGIVIHPENAFNFDFIVYKGDKTFTESQKKQEYTKLIKYFMASLAVPDEDQWVNLSPYEKNRIIKEDFGKTEMGRDLLAQDYLLKQITASLIYPQDKLGQKFWDEIYSRAYKQFGTSNIPVNTFNKVWILPDNADIYEKGNVAYLYKSHLKVMLEEDYLSLKKHSGIEGIKITNGTNTIGSQVVREIILPQLEKEVNEDKNFAPLRQVFSGMILAAWYKRALRESLLGKIYDNKAKVKGIDQDPKNNETIYRQYLKAYKKGVFNFIKEDVDRYTNETIPRKYFSGGATNFAMVTDRQGNPLRDKFGFVEIKGLNVNPSGAASAAMTSIGNLDTRLDLAVATVDPRTTQSPSAAMASRKDVENLTYSFGRLLGASSSLNIHGDALGTTHRRIEDLLIEIKTALQEKFASFPAGQSLSGIFQRYNVDNVSQISGTVRENVRGLILQLDTQVSKAAAGESPAMVVPAQVSSAANNILLERVSTAWNHRWGGFYQGSFGRNSIGITFNHEGDLITQLNLRVNAGPVEWTKTVNTPISFPLSALPNYGILPQQLAQALIETPWSHNAAMATPVPAKVARVIQSVKSVKIDPDTVQQGQVWPASAVNTKSPDTIQLFINHNADGTAVLGITTVTPSRVGKLVGADNRLGKLLQTKVSTSLVEFAKGEPVPSIEQIAPVVRGGIMREYIQARATVNDHGAWLVRAADYVAREMNRTSHPIDELKILDGMETLRQALIEIDPGDLKSLPHRINSVMQVVTSPLGKNKPREIMDGVQAQYSNNSESLRLGKIGSAAYLNELNYKQQTLIYRNDLAFNVIGLENARRTAAIILAASEIGQDGAKDLVSYIQNFNPAMMTGALIDEVTRTAWTTLAQASSVEIDPVNLPGVYLKHYPNGQYTFEIQRRGINLFEMGLGSILFRDNAVSIMKEKGIPTVVKMATQFVQDRGVERYTTLGKISAIMQTLTRKHDQVASQAMTAAGIKRSVAKLAVPLALMASSLPGMSAARASKPALGTPQALVKPGGIDLNAVNLNLQIKRDGNGVPLPVSQQDLENIHIDGLVPVILEIRPAAASPILSQITTPSPVGVS